MQGTNALEYLTDNWGFGGVGEALAAVPLSERCQALLEGVDRQLISVIDQVAHDAVAGGRQEPTPGHFEVLYGRLITAPGVLPGTSLYVAIYLSHHLTPTNRTEKPQLDRSFHLYHSISLHYFI
ncbi:hypothetical protein NAU58_07370 [Pseudomonas stutzeri]|uniref:hypothetical protein n=1 Tax=Stutzerimonas stutzeri TaxID=316 RepID=UPI00210D96A9|nr:hypothetical protein [Stutzerimonas stutzeri]MCQ4295391.1 hypothetical protein [Stutzerimonas stutzeri]